MHCVILSVGLSVGPVLKMCLGVGLSVGQYVGMDVVLNMGIWVMEGVIPLALMDLSDNAYILVTSTQTTNAT